MTTHEDNFVCVDQINKDLVHDGNHDFSVLAENGGADGSDVGVKQVLICSQLRFAGSPVNVSAHNRNATTLKEILFFRKLDKIHG